MQYLIIGNGRVAKHLCHYFSSLELKHQQWHRQQPLDALEHAVSQVTHIIIAIPDAAIEPFIHTHLLQATATRLHCSGALVTPLAHTIHPLQTFTPSLYATERYRDIPFIIEAEGPSFDALLPGVPNPHFAIPRKDKTYYHAQCVMANNFTTILWQRFFDTMASTFNIPKTALLPYLQQTLENLNTESDAALTGPIQRQDTITIKAHQTALADQNTKAIYDGFIKALGISV